VAGGQGAGTLLDAKLAIGVALTLAAMVPLLHR
jgi:hypothetical protein